MISQKNKKNKELLLFLAFFCLSVQIFIVQNCCCMKICVVFIQNYCITSISIPTIWNIIKNHIVNT